MATEHHPGLSSHLSQVPLIHRCVLVGHQSLNVPFPIYRGGVYNPYLSTGERVHLLHFHLLEYTPNGEK